MDAAGAASASSKTFMAASRSAWLRARASSCKVCAIGKKPGGGRRVAAPIKEEAGEEATAGGVGKISGGPGGARRTNGLYARAFPVACVGSDAPALPAQAAASGRVAGGVGSDRLVGRSSGGMPLLSTRGGAEWKMRWWGKKGPPNAVGSVGCGRALNEAPDPGPPALQQMNAGTHCF